MRENLERTTMNARPNMKNGTAQVRQPAPPSCLNARERTCVPVTATASPVRRHVTANNGNSVTTNNGNGVITTPPRHRRTTEPSPPPVAESTPEEAAPPRRPHHNRRSMFDGPTHTQFHKGSDRNVD